MQTIMIICYLGSAGIATGTLGLCVVKIVNQNKKKRNWIQFNLIFYYLQKNLNRIRIKKNTSGPFKTLSYTF